MLKLSVSDEQGLMPEKCAPISPPCGALPLHAPPCKHSPLTTVMGSQVLTLMVNELPKVFLSYVMPVAFWLAWKMGRVQLVLLR